VTTHPSLLAALAEVFRDGREATYGDSPGFHSPAAAMTRAGLAEVAEETGLELADFTAGEVRTLPRKAFPLRATIARGVIAADCVVSVCKLKTHGLTRMSGAVKNQFGMIPGLEKKAFHLRYPTPGEFSKMLVGVNLLAPPRLHVMDGVVGMDGNGPRGGDPAPMGVLLFSADPVALDAVMCRLVDLRPEYLPTAVPGRAWGLGTYREEDMEILGESIERFTNDRFRVSRRRPGMQNPRGLRLWWRNTFGQRPVIDTERCVDCGQCTAACPTDPPSVRPPQFDYGRCLRCYCCQEICPEGAIFVR
jgi:uncharacterized protein (DUF362 family)/Pyruvate/2-oxoacid:ferredoxin oxidoreductase delta subunit